MMPLNFASVGEQHTIKRVKGRPEVKKHLSDLGFTPGGSVSIVLKNGNDIICNIRDSRIAITSTLASKVFI